MLLASLLGRTTATGRVALVVAHPDDETIAAGGSLHLLPDLLLVHVTDGAPRGLGDVERAGFATPAAYAAARRGELHAALAVAGATPDMVELLIPDQDASLHMHGITARLAALLDAHGVTAVLTHAYEGGHPDHDATAFCVAQAAAGRELVEFPTYHAGPNGESRKGCFLPLLPPGEGRDEGRCSAAARDMAGAARGPHPDPLPEGEGEAALSPAQQARKRRLLACFHTQSDFLQHFPTAVEPFRPATPDFTRPPHPGLLNYERWQWPMTGARWRELARC